MDKNAKLLWSYEPQYYFNVVILNDGSMVMVEGTTVRHYDLTGKKLNEVLIPEITPIKVDNAFYDIGPRIGGQRVTGGMLPLCA